MLKFISLVEDYSFGNFVCLFRNELSEKVGGRPRASTILLHFEHLPGKQCNCRSVKTHVVQSLSMKEHFMEQHLLENSTTDKVNEISP